MTIVLSDQPPEVAAPVLSCPIGWCTDHSHKCHMGPTEYHNGNPVYLLQTDATPYVYVGGHVWAVPGEARKAADLLTRAGCPELAAAVTRLARLAAS